MHTGYGLRRLSHGYRILCLRMTDQHLIEFMPVAEPVFVHHVREQRYPLDIVLRSPMRTAACALAAYLVPYSLSGAIVSTWYKPPSPWCLWPPMPSISQLTGCLIHVLPVVNGPGFFRLPSAISSRANDVDKYRAQGTAGKSVVLPSNPTARR